MPQEPTVKNTWIPHSLHWDLMALVEKRIHQFELPRIKIFVLDLLLNKI